PTSVVRRQNCGRYPLKNGVCRPPSSLVNTYTSALHRLCGVMDPGFASTCPRSTSSLSTPRSKQPTLSPACPSSSSFRNISTPVTTVLRVSRNPTISTSSPTFTTPRSPRPAPTPPPPLFEKIAPVGLQNGLPLRRFRPRVGPPPAPPRLPRPSAPLASSGLRVAPSPDRR